MVRSVRSRASPSFDVSSDSLSGSACSINLHLQADAQQALAGFVVQLAADAAALHFLDVQHVLGQAADLLSRAAARSSISRAFSAAIRQRSAAAASSSCSRGSHS